MKYISSEQEYDIPEGVNIEVKSRVVTVKGPLGTLTRSFKHVPFELNKVKGKDGKSKLQFRVWLQKKKRNATIGTVRTTIKNMAQGVKVGYKFKMVLAYSHFPISINIVNDGKVTHLLFRLSKSRISWDSR